MKLTKKPDDFMQQQEIFTGVMINRIADLLEESGINGKQLTKLTEKIAFEITCMIDDVSETKYDGIVANPYLTFMTNDFNELIHLGGNSTAHEMVPGIVSAIFDEDS
jgi:hypothetical protein